METDQDLQIYNNTKQKCIFDLSQFLLKRHTGNLG